jgi:hypothetical protein
MKAAAAPYGKDAFLLCAKSTKNRIIDTFQGKDSYALRKTADALAIILDRVHKYPCLVGIIKRMPARVDIVTFCDAVNEISDNSAIAEPYIREALQYIIEAAGGSAEVPNVPNTPPRIKKAHAGIVPACAVLGAVVLIAVAVWMTRPVGGGDLPYAETTTTTTTAVPAETATTATSAVPAETAATTTSAVPAETTTITTAAVPAEAATTAATTTTAVPAEAATTAATTTTAATYEPRTTTPHENSSFVEAELTGIRYYPQGEDAFVILTTDTNQSDSFGIIGYGNSLYFGGIYYNEKNDTFAEDYLGVRVIVYGDGYYCFAGEWAYSAEDGMSALDGYGVVYESTADIAMYGRWSNGAIVEEYSDLNQFPGEYIVKIDNGVILFSNADDHKLAYFDPYNGLLWVTTDLSLKWYMGEAETPFVLENIDMDVQALFSGYGEPVSIPEGVKLTTIEPQRVF